MSISLRGATLRIALETALGEPVVMQSTTTGVRLSAPAPDPTDPAWGCVIEVLGQADAWGSSDGTDTPQIWAHLVER
ncbi:hypothetical protein [Streptomyces sp. NPDC093094]|uniref:hypothetical protein n=1 Tax=Streptomyces sp. NPDC093094 TaxID=3366026 RepID=UPI003821D909